MGFDLRPIHPVAPELGISIGILNSLAKESTLSFLVFVRGYRQVLGRSQKPVVKSICHSFLSILARFWID